MLYSAFVIAFVVWFIHACTWEGMIFSGIAQRLWTLPTWLKKPLYDCPICMAPWWGMLILILQGNPPCLNALIAVCIAGGINAVIVSFIYGSESGRTDTDR